MVSMSTGLARTSSELVVGSATMRIVSGCGLAGVWEAVALGELLEQPAEAARPCPVAAARSASAR